MTDGGAAGGGASGVSGLAGSGVDAGARVLDGGGSAQTLPLSTNDLVFDRTRGVLYATIDSTAGAGNSVVTIDPASATVIATLPVGGFPTVLAISDDCSALYVGVGTLPQIDRAETVRRIDLASMTAGPAVSLGSNTISRLTAGQIVAVPGSSTRYVVSRRQPGFTPDFAGLALYDGTTLLAQLDSFYGTGDTITFVDSSTLIGCSNDQEPSQLIRYSVTSAAITPGMMVSGLITGGQRTRIIFNGGWIFASDGQTVSAATLASVGTYSDSILAGYASAAPFPDPDGANVWFLRTASSSDLLDFDRTTFQLRRTISLIPVSDDVDLPNATALVRWSPTGLAFRTYNRVYLLTVPN